MRVGVHIVTFTPPGGTQALGPTLARAGRAAENAGVASLSVMDHYFQLGGELGAAEDPMLEGYTTLGFLAGNTSTVNLQLLVTGVTYRHPGLLAKIVSTLDVLSGGRATLGIGAAWYEREHTALGVPFPPAAERLDRLEEALQVVRQMWSDDNGPFNGRYYRLAETVNTPQPLRRPHPPIMVGGGGERRTLRLVARYADAWNLIIAPRDGLDTLRAKTGILREHCVREGTDFDRIRRTILYVAPVDATPERGATFADEMARFAELGVEEVFVMPFGGDLVGYVTDLGAHVVPRLADL